MNFHAHGNALIRFATRTRFVHLALCAVLVASNTAHLHAQKRQAAGRPITIPVTLRARASNSPTRNLEPADLIVKEDGTPQQILSLRNTERLPLSLAILIQDDVVSSISNEINPIADYVRNLPEGSRVLIGYIGTGSLRVRQRFTENTERAARALRIPLSSASAAPYNPYVQIREALRRFESLPSGRRAILVVSDGLDLSNGSQSSAPTQSLDLDRAIRESQRRGVAIYSFYAPTLGGTANAGGILVGNAQGSLNRLSEETGGRAFFQGTGAPVSFAPFLRDLTTALGNQYALTYLSTNSDKGFRRVEVTTQIDGIEIEHPRGYVR